MSINIKLSDAAMDELQRCSSREERGRKLLTFIEEEVEKFQQWSQANLGGALARFEIAAVKTYLYRSIAGELSGDGDIMNLPRVVLPDEASHVS